MSANKILYTLFFLTIAGVVDCNRPTIGQALLTFLATLERYENDINDVVFLLDESGSIGAERFPAVLNFTQLIVQRFLVSPDHTRVAVVTFATETVTHMDYIKYPRDNNMCTLLSKLSQIPYAAQWTHTDKAMRAADYILSYSRPNANKIIILLTDGQSNDGHSPVQVSRELKAKRYIIFAVGVADVNVEEINAVATTINHTYILDNFDNISKINKYLVDDTRDSMALVKDSQQCNDCTNKQDCCDEHANCYCGLRTGRYECTCFAGYRGKGRKGECKKCSKGTYKTEALNSECTPCPAHSTTTKEGSTSFNDCICDPGYEKMGNSCIAVRCASLSPPEGGFLIPTHCNNTFGTQCSLKCRAGYCPFSCRDNFHLPHIPAQYFQLPTRTCLESKEWTGEEFYCEKMTCPVLQFPFGGKHNCTDKDFGYGSTCKFTCDNGYQLHGSATRSCLINGLWSGEDARCERTFCPPLKTNQNLKLKPKDCSLKKMAFGSVCQYHCGNGYTMVSDDNETAGVFKCESNQKWTGGKITCKDVKPPKIACPNNIEVDAADSKAYAQIKWEAPVATDNLEVQSVRIEEPKWLAFVKPPYNFMIGKTKIVYRATDISGLSSDCSFTVTVLDKEPPKLISCPNDIEIQYDKNDGTPVTWENPIFEDNSKKKPDVKCSRNSGDLFSWGDYKIKCTATDESGNRAYCDFAVKVKSYSCPYYPPPANGVMVCDTWEDGKICSIDCHEGYEMVNGVKLPILYACGKSKKQGKTVGKWKPISSSKLRVPWPDCAKTRLPRSLNMTLNYQYSVDRCSEDILQKMKEDFVKNLKKHPAGSIYCPKKCTPENVNITCGQQKLRTKRSPESNMKYRRQTNNDLQVLSITFSIELLPNHATSTDDTDKTKMEEEIIKSSDSVANDIQSIISGNVKNAYELNSAPVPKTHFDVIAICSMGQIRINTSCVDCPAGTYKEDISGRCLDCPHASYQDEERQISCKACPVGYTTHEVKSKSKDDCKAPCQPGTHSETTFEPCLACLLNTYQEKSGRKDCLKCPHGLYTWKVGSNSSNDCVAPCTAGTYSDTGFQPCVLCDSHSYQDQEQQTNCNICPNKTATTFRGAKNAEDCKEIDICKELKPCHERSICKQNDKDYECICPKGLMGTHCEINPDDCESTPCLNNGTCIDEIGNFTCMCPKGWNGHQCENNIDDCNPNPCFHGGECIDMLNAYECVCKLGFQGKQCEVNIYECESNPCVNNGTCFDKENGYRCCCPTGYYGQNCEKEFDICNTITCENGGSCSSSLHNVSCLCPYGFDGELCENNIDDCVNVNCLNGGTCVDDIGNATCRCPKQFDGEYCEEALTPEFMLSFPSPSASNYVELKNDDLLYAITAAFFMKTSFKDANSRATPVSYSYKDEGRLVDNALTLLDTNSFVLYIHGEAIHTEYSANSDPFWHHYAVTWKKENGEWVFYVDGKAKVSGSKLGENKYMHPGIFILGQEQDGFGDYFSALEAFSGDITQFNVWDYALTPEEVKKVSSTCGMVGNVIPWYSALKSIHGDVITSQDVDKCNDVGFCHEDSCDCFNANHTIRHSCKHSIKDCIQEHCLHDQSCVTYEDRSFCNCSSAFEGRHCEYDVDECLVDNGGCKYICINEVGGYHCECPEEMILTEDSKSCKETLFCVVDGDVYPDGEKWMNSCQNCVCEHGNVKCEDTICNDTTCHPEETLLKMPGDCCPKCVTWSFCVISPNKTITTFDMATYEVDGDCIYTAVEECISGQYKMQIQHIQNGTEMNLILHNDCSEIVMTFDGRIFVDDVQVMMPYKTEDVEISEANALFTIWTHSNLLVQWNFTDEILIGVPIAEANQICGLCRNFAKHYKLHGRYPLMQRDAIGLETCYGVFEDTSRISSSGSIFVWGSAKVLYLFTAFILTLYYYHNEKHFS